MSHSGKYSSLYGCCICGTKHSTSQFRPWYDHYSETIYCRVFSLQSLKGRRGYVCNPCVLFIKRTVNSMDNDTLNSDPRKRLDSKLKGVRPSNIPDIFPPGVSQPTKIMGYFARNRRCIPKYAFTGQPFINIFSPPQSIPSISWQDPQDMLEEEDGAEQDYSLYRRAAHMKRVMGERPWMREKEEQRLSSCQNLTEDTPCRSHAKAESGNELVKDSSLAAHKTHRTYGTRANVLKGKIALNGADLAFYKGDDDEDTDTSSETIDGEEEDLPEAQSEGLSSSSEDLDPECSGFSRKRKRTDVDVESAAKKLRSESSGEQLMPARNRRVMRLPIKNFKRPTVSFMDCSYWQKNKLCSCVNLYVGPDGRICVVGLSKTKTCPAGLKKLLQLQKEEVKQKPGQPQLQQSPRSSSPDELLESGSITSKEADDEESEVDSLSSELQRHTESAHARSDSSGDSRILDHNGCIGPKKTGADPESQSESASILSSGDDELSENRCAIISSSPLLEKSCSFFNEN